MNRMITIRTYIPGMVAKYLRQSYGLQSVIFDDLLTDLSNILTIRLFLGRPKA